MQKKIVFERNMYKKDIEGTCLNKLTRLISTVLEKKLKDIERMCLNNLKKFIGSDMEKNCSKSFSNASNFLNIEEEK